MEIKRGRVGAINKTNGAFQLVLGLSNKEEPSIYVPISKFRRDDEFDVDKLEIGAEVLVVYRQNSEGSLEPSEWFFSSRQRMNMVVDSARESYRRASGLPIDGEIVITKDGKEKRIYNPHDDGNIQPAIASFYLNSKGASLSAGTLEYPIPANTLQETGELREARFWIFNDLEPRADNGADFFIPVRVWKEVEGRNG